jgi:hypothetical protein
MDRKRRKLEGKRRNKGQKNFKGKHGKGEPRPNLFESNI